jgi:hypothetical protein
MPNDQGKTVYSPIKSYSGVVTQQGRVQLDSDTNEQSAIDGHKPPPKAEVVAPAGRLPLVPDSDK